MSINVNVSGNPVSIYKGRMVTADPNHAKKEFDKRRLLRLEQVRQQSKDIAEDVRNKVRREKKKQEHEIEEEGRQKLKNWQNRKLLELQTQYKEAIEELGAGHKEAEALKTESEIAEGRKEQNKKVASDRGRKAANKLQVEKNKSNLKKSIPIQQKKLVRDIENIRSALVTNIKKKDTSGPNFNKKKRKKASAEISITIPQSYSESEETRRLDREYSSGRRSPYAYSENSENLQTSLVSNENDSASNLRNQESMDQHEVPAAKANLSTAQQTSGMLHTETIYKKMPYTETVSQKMISTQTMNQQPSAQIIHERIKKVIPAPDTRISDRIKRREIMASELDYCDIVAETNPSPLIKSNTQISEAIESRYLNRGTSACNNMYTCGKSQMKCCYSCGQPLNESRCTCAKHRSRCCLVCGHCIRCTCRKDQSKCSLISGQEPNENNGKGRKSPSPLSSLLHYKFKDSNVPEDVPTKPPVKLKESKGSHMQPPRGTLESDDPHKVQFYDHANRFSQEKLNHSYVEKITADSIEVLPNMTSEAEWYDKMKQRDREAQMRGQRALEKEKVQREYKEIVKKLPLLQKKERIWEINKDKPEFHMAEERLKERERKKQNHLDNAYTKLFPDLKPAVVTLPRKRHEAEVTIAPDDEEPRQSINVAKWDVDSAEPKMFTIEEVQEIIKAFTEQKPKDRQAKLKELLSGLRLQKEQLLNEIRSLPRNQSIDELINDLNSVGDSGKPKKKDRMHNRKRCHEENEKESSLDSTTESSSSSHSMPHRKEKSRFTVGKCPDYGKTPSPRKKAKMKSKKNVLILQNTSTQTTPKPVSPRSPLHQDKPKMTEKLQKGLVPAKLCNKVHVPCDCNKENVSGAGELCQILIKINDNEEPEVVVTAKEKEHQISDLTLKNKQKIPRVNLDTVATERKVESKSIAVGTDEARIRAESEERHKLSKASLPDAKKKPKKELRSVGMDRGEFRRNQPLPKEKSDFKAKSWREQFSRNSLSSSSTSYVSPPNFNAIRNKNLSIHGESTRHPFYNLHKQPQQSNLYDASALTISPSPSQIGERTIDPILLDYIKKLLSMTRDSVDELTVSTSNVQTPSQSVVEIDSNNPLAQLHNMIRYFNLKAEDLARELSCTPDLSGTHYESFSSCSGKSPREHRPEPIKKGKHTVVDQSVPDEFSDTYSGTNTGKSANSIMAQFTNVTDSCSKRIANLASLIQQIRDEKIEMLQHPPGSVMEDKLLEGSPGITGQDTSTAYLDLPEGKECISHSSLDNSDDEEIHQRLLEIDLILANKLRKFAPLSDNPIPEEDENRKDMAAPQESSTDDTTKELWTRLRHLTQVAVDGPQETTVPDKIKPNTQTFVSFLSDIPKLPKFEAQPEGKFDFNSFQRRPPPSKGLIIAKKFNGNISLVPHELSTIAEADSQVSTKISSNPVSPNNSKTSQGTSPRKEQETIDTPGHQEKETPSTTKSSKSVKSQVSSKIVSSEEKNKSTDRSKSSKFGTPSHYSLSLDVSTKSKTSGDASLNQSQSMTTTSKKSLLVSSSSSEDMESIESMLKSIGMEWAIPTLHKTQEALALASSSSSQDVSIRHRSSSSDSTSSEISLKEFLSRQLISKLSSSSMNSSLTPSLSLEFSDMSAIQFSSSNKMGKRTSTPITSSASKTKSSSKQVGISNGSNISSGNTNEDRSFHSLSDHSKGSV